MKHKWKITIWIISIILFLMLCAGGYYVYWYYELPHYRIIQKDRDISFGSNDTTQFIISPAKIEVSNLKLGKTLNVPVKIINKGLKMDFKIGDQQPSLYDKGYSDATQFNDYTYKFSSSEMVIGENQTKNIVFSITKEVENPNLMQEKGFIIVQHPETLHMITLARGYIFEVLLPQ